MEIVGYWRALVLLLALSVGCFGVGDGVEEEKAGVTMDAGGESLSGSTAVGASDLYSNREGRHIQEGILRAVRSGHWVTAAQLASGLCKKMGLTYRVHFEQQCPSKLMKWAITQAWGTQDNNNDNNWKKVNAGRVKGSIEAVDALLEECQQRLEEDRSNETKTAMERLYEMSPCDLSALEAVLTAEWMLAFGKASYPLGQRKVVRGLRRYSREELLAEGGVEKVMEGGPFVLTGGLGLGGSGATSDVTSGGGELLSRIAEAARRGAERRGRGIPEAEFYPRGLQSFEEHNDVRRMVQLEEGVGKLRGEDVDFGAYMHWYMHEGEWADILKELWGDGEGEGGWFDLFPDSEKWTGKCFEGDALKRAEFYHNLRWYGMYAGTPGVGMYAHKDRHATSSFQVQLAGTKRWRLCNPRGGLGDEAMYSKFKVHADGLARTANLGRGGGSGGGKPFDVDYEQRPLFRLADCIEDEAVEGEFVYYPADWWHQTWTVGEGEDGVEEGLSLSLSALVVDSYSWRAVRDSLAWECDMVELGRVETWSKEMCKVFRECVFEEWNHMMG
ncbi:hypothetical protein TrLO_g10571 [Triparma laevis f. longispina]|uniref:JmjC domain-containing protein n=1 Tax=Triparma laevis f. longispina TaxID=1714387 RepID=A0A9W7FS00_9STRA|nr:hypothetical protein TrLO_g10571 [Triparma laevis f. longispina]